MSHSQRSSIDEFAHHLRRLLDGEYIPASAADIAAFTTAIGQPLPDDFLALYRDVSNGGPFAGGEPALFFSAYRWYDLESLIRIKQTLDNAAHPGWRASLLPLLGHQHDVIAVDTHSGAVSCFHFHAAQQRFHHWRLTDTFTDWLLACARAFDKLAEEKSVLADFEWHDTWIGIAAECIDRELHAARGDAIALPVPTGLNHENRARGLCLRGELERLGDTELVPASPEAYDAFVERAGCRFPDSFAALYLVVSNGGTWRLPRWYLPDSPHPITFPPYRFYDLAGIFSSKRDLESSGRHPAWSPTWFPFLSDDFGVVAIEGTPTGSVWSYDIKSREASRIAPSFDVWLAAAVAVLEQTSADQWEYVHRRIQAMCALTQ